MCRIWTIYKIKINIYHKNNNKKSEQKKKNKIGVYRIIDLYSSNKETRFAFRYKHRENQTQEQSDNSILMNCINNFYKTNPYLRSK